MTGRLPTSTAPGPSVTSRRRKIIGLACRDGHDPETQSQSSGLLAVVATPRWKVGQAAVLLLVADQEERVSAGAPSGGRPFRARLLPVCCPARRSGTAPARRK